MCRVCIIEYKNYCLSNPFIINSIQAIEKRISWSKFDEMQICNLVLAHKSPHQLNRLLKHLSYPGCHTYVHVDEKADIKIFENATADLKDVTLISQRVTVHWGGPTMITAVAASIAEIKASGIHYDYINLVSGQDFPIKPISEFVSFLEQNKGKQFISYLEGEAAAAWWRSGADRFQKYHFNEFRIPYKYFLQKLVNKILPVSMSRRQHSCH